ncbi:MAG: NAD(P)/FAD-dependent oxidoreductase [Trueperaceae bacterium]
MTANTPIWEDNPWTSLQKLDHDLTPDVCVIGLGGSGLSCIQEFLKYGKSVVGVDAGSVAGGAAGRNGGFLLAGLALPHHEAVQKLGRERAKKLYELSLEQRLRIQIETPEAVRQVGSLRTAYDKQELKDCEAQYGAMCADDLSVQRYEGPEGQGLLFPHDGAFQPLLRCRLLARQVLKNGALLFENTSVTTFQGTTVITKNARVTAKTVVVAVDGKLEHLLPELSPRVRTARLQMLATTPTSEVSIPRPVYHRWGYEYWQQLPSGSIALGGFRDHFKESEWTNDNTPSSEIQGLLETFLREKLNVQADITHRWAANVCYTQNAMPIAEEVRENVWAIGAYCGTGNLMGALCGRALAEHVSTGSSEAWSYLQSDSF